MKFLFLLVPALLIAATSDKKEDERIRNQFLNYVEHARKVKAEDKKLSDAWEKLCKGRGMQAGRDEYGLPAPCVTPPPPPPPPAAAPAPAVEDPKPAKQSNRKK